MSFELLAYLRYMFTSTLKYMYIQPCKGTKMHLYLGNIRLQAQSNTCIYNHAWLQNLHTQPYQTTCI